MSFDYVLTVHRSQDGSAEPIPSSKRTCEQAPYELFANIELDRSIPTHLRQGHLSDWLEELTPDQDEGYTSEVDDTDG